MIADVDDEPPASDLPYAKRMYGNIRFVRETFHALDENGEIVAVTKTREFRTRWANGRTETIEMPPVLSIAVLGEVVPIDDPVYQYQVLRTGMKLRRQS